MKVEYLSASRAKTYDKCPREYHYTYEKKLPPKPDHPLSVVGSCIHKVMEISTKARRLSSLKWKPLRNPDYLFESARRKFKVDADVWHLVPTLVGNALRWGYFRHMEYVYGVEVPFFESLEDGTKIKGFIDRLDFRPDFADIIDLKTQKREFTKEELIKSIQGRTYNVAIRKKLGFEGNARVSFWTLRHRVQRMTLLTREDAKQDEENLIKKAEEIREDDGDRMRPSALCPYCIGRDECPGSKMGIKSRFKNKFK